MVGKIKRGRQRLHQVAVRPREPLVDTGTPEPRSSDAVRINVAAMDVCLPGSTGWKEPVGGKDWTFLSSDIFSTTKIDPVALVQKLDTDSKSSISAKKGVIEKPLLPKKEKMKLRREKWLQKIDALKLAHQKQKAQAKRKATPVVGDMQPLVDALPELSELITIGKPRDARKRQKTNVKKKALPTDYSQMKPAQKRKLLEEEVSRFREVIVNPSYKANPLAAIGEHLAKRMKEEEEGNAT
ncbi:ribosome biogenesis protein SLX9 homolog [Microcaecilia unicolor]|uniref:Protein FAM207A n=1 Tax=Microcaecilia unicolor TaxID=1415580 RepID=A0A6P7YJZ1_9AMPH|nr:protein FAM207A [Microcaecilia unicolor]